MIPQADEYDIKNRLDLTLLKELRDKPQDIQFTRAKFLQSWDTDEQISRLTLKNLENLENVISEDNERALRNIVNYWIEPIIFQSMNRGQARDYCLSIMERFDLKLEDEIPQAGDAPLLIDTVHHVCCFSFNFALFYNVLISDYGYEKFILFHAQSELDQRILACKDLIQNVKGLDVVTIQLAEGWHKQLIQEVTNKSALFYLSDMPPKLFGKQYQSGKTSSHLQFSYSPDQVIDIEGMSIAPMLARKLKANHIILDVPSQKTVRLRRWQQNATLNCPLPDWVFWPALRQLYTEIDFFHKVKLNP